MEHLTESTRFPFVRRVRRALHNRFRAASTWIVFHSVGRLVNAVKLPIMIEHRPDWHYDHPTFSQYGSFYRAWNSGNLRNNAGDMSRLYMLVQNCSQILHDGVQGDFVELGVYKGNSAAIFADFARRNDRKLFLFDTFAGFDRRDINGVDAIAHVEFGDTSVQGVQRLVGVQNVTYVQGFFPESCDGVDLPERIAIAHIDCDLHDPMKAALERFYPLMSRGGLMIMHDYSSGHWVGTTKAVDDFFADKPEKPILIPDKSGSAIVRIRSF